MSKKHKKSKVLFPETIFVSRDNEYFCADPKITDDLNLNSDVVFPVAEYKLVRSFKCSIQETVTEVE